MRVFFDTNVLASGVAARGLCAELIEGVFNEHELLTCEPILACAIAGRADVFVTGDKALLELREVQGIPIFSPRQFWQKLAGLDEPDTAR